MEPKPVIYHERTSPYPSAMTIVQLTQPAQPMGEQRVTFRQITWLGYQQLLRILGDHRSARLTYDRGLLEITMPLEIHELSGELIALLIRILVVELGLKMKSIASTTLNREDLNRGVEPDKAFYIQNQSLVAGRTVDLAQDPPPDLVVEVDITHTDIDKPGLYASLGVPEFWRYDGQIVRFYQLENSQYRETDTSPTFPDMPKQRLYEFLAQAQVDEVEAELALRAWVRQQISDRAKL
jgi:Uma2 family endonuclease